MILSRARRMVSSSRFRPSKILTRPATSSRSFATAARIVGTRPYVLALPAEGRGVGVALLPMVAVGAVTTELRGEALGGRGLRRHALHVGERRGGLLPVPHERHPDGMPEHPVGELHVPGPRPERLRHCGVERELEVVLELVAGEELLVRLVVDDLDGLGIDAIDAVDDAEHREPASGEPEALLDREDGRGVDAHAPPDASSASTNRSVCSGSGKCSASSYRITLTFGPSSRELS